MLDALVTVVNGMNPFHVVASAIAQQVFAMAWFGCIVNHIDRYYRAADKGVRRFEFAIHRYPPVAVAAITFLCAILRTVVMLCIVSFIGATSLVDYEYAAVLTAVVGLMGVHRHFACQRPIQLFVTEGGYEVAAAMIAAIVCYFMKAYKM